MGKYNDDKKARRAERRARPVEAIPNATEIAMQLEENGSTTDQSRDKYPVLAQLFSSNEHDRELGCGSIAHIVLDSSSEDLAIILEHGTSTKLISLLQDNFPGVRIAAAGALRNLTLADDGAVCERLVREDIMKSLLAIIQHYSQNFSKETGAELKNSRELVVQVVAIFTNLCENSPKALELFSNEQAIKLALQFLHHESHNEELVIETADLLNVVTENNAICCQIIVNSQELSQFLNGLLSSTTVNPYVKILICSALYNISMCVSSLPHTITTLFGHCLQAIQYDSCTEIGRLMTEHIQFCHTNNTEKLPNEIEEKLNTEITKWRHFMKAQQLALEILTNLVSGEDDEGSFNNNNNNNAEFVEVDPNATVNISSNVPEFIKKVVTEANLLQKMLEKSNFPSESFQQLFVQYWQLLEKTADQDVLREVQGGSSVNIRKHIYETIKSSQVRAINLVGNLLLMYDEKELGDMNVLWRFFCQLCVSWNTEFQVLPSAVQQKDEIGYVLDAITANMWTLVRKWFAKGVSHVAPFTPETGHIAGILELARSSPYEETRSNCAGMLGILGQQETFQTIIPDIADALIRCLENNSSFVVAETLNSIFDVFAETNYNEIVTKQDMLNKLVKTLASIKNKLKTSKRSMDEEEVERLEEAQENLTRFLKYKYDQLKA